MAELADESTAQLVARVRGRSDRAAEAMDELEAAMSEPLAPVVTGTNRVARTAADGRIPVALDTGFVKVVEARTGRYFAHDALRNRWPRLVGATLPGDWPRNFVATCDTMPVLASKVLGVDEVVRKEVLVRRTEFESMDWSAMTVAAATYRLTKPERPDADDAEVMVADEAGPPVASTSKKRRSRAKPAASTTTRLRPRRPRHRRTSKASTWKAKPRPSIAAKTPGNGRTGSRAPVAPVAADTVPFLAADVLGMLVIPGYTAGKTMDVPRSEAATQQWSTATMMAAIARLEHPVD